MKVKMTALADITHSRMNRIILLQQDPISPVPVVSVGGPGFHSQSFRVASLCFKQDGSILRVDNIHTLIVPNLLPGKNSMCWRDLVCKRPFKIAFTLEALCFVYHRSTNQSQLFWCKLKVQYWKQKFIMVKSAK